MKAKAKKKPAKRQTAKRRPIKAKKLRKRKPLKGGRWVRQKRIKSLDELIHWYTPVSDRWGINVTFDSVVVPLRLLPREIREHYTFKDVDLEYAMAYPGKPSKNGKIYFVVQRQDGLREAWHLAPSPSLRQAKKYWQIDHTIKWYKPWPW